MEAERDLFRSRWVEASSKVDELSAALTRSEDARAALLDEFTARFGRELILVSVD